MSDTGELARSYMSSPPPSPPPPEPMSCPAPEHYDLNYGVFHNRWVNLPPSQHYCGSYPAGPEPYDPPCGSYPAGPEPYDLDNAAFHNRWDNTRRAEWIENYSRALVSENGEVHVNENHFMMMMRKLRGSVPVRYGTDSAQPPTIYRVPEELKSPHCSPRGEYEAAAVCIGYNWYEANMMSMLQLDEYKWCCVRQLINRHSRLLEPARTPDLLHGCFVRMKRLLPQILASYFQFQDPFPSGGPISDDKLAEMALLDGCFILHRLLKYARRSAEMEARDGDASDQVDDDDDWTQVYGRCWVWQLVTRDLLLLENQIPFLVVRELFQVLKNDDEHKDLLVTGSLRIFRSLSPQKLHDSPIACDEVHHLLHLFYLSVGFPPSESQRPSRRQADGLLSELPQWIPCAKELEETGVRFRMRKKATSFLEIKFARGVLEIPQLQLNDSSESLLRNLIAFEQTYPGTRLEVSTYAVFMDCLIKSPQDMRILDLHGVLVNHLNNGTNPWCFFSKISAQVHWPTDNYLVGLMDEVNKYTDSRRHRWRAALVRDYFSNPWVVMSVLAALLLLCMTVLQTFFTVYPYFKPPK